MSSVLVRSGEIFLFTLVVSHKHIFRTKQKQTCQKCFIIQVNMFTYSLSLVQWILWTYSLTNVFAKLKDTNRVLVTQVNIVTCQNNPVTPRVIESST